MVSELPQGLGSKLHRRDVLMRLALTAGVCALSCPSIATADAELVDVIRYPAMLDKRCRTGNAKIFDECGSQRAIFAAALKQANHSEKTLLVSYGAEWCIWCHVFDAYINGKYENFEYEFDDGTVHLKEHGDLSSAHEADLLHRYVAENFVIAYIEENYSKDGEDVLARAGALASFTGELPFIFTATRRGRWAATFDYREVETRREGHDWFRGYDRERLLSQLKAMRVAATSP
jgi:hypothetical protein